MASMRRIVQRLLGRLPAGTSLRVKKVGAKVAEKLPRSVTAKIRPFAETAASTGEPTSLPVDPMRLALTAAIVRTDGVTGRAAAGTASDPENPDRLHRALFGDSMIGRSDSGGRPVGGIFAADLRSALERAGHPVVPFLPGTSTAAAKKVEVVLIDLSGFDGVWAGALDAAGVGLIREIMLAIRSAQEIGASCWVVMRGGSLHTLGALALQNLHGVETAVPGTGTSEQQHFTEHPGDAPSGVLDMVRALEVGA